MSRREVESASGQTVQVSWKSPGKIDMYGQIKSGAIPTIGQPQFDEGLKRAAPAINEMRPRNSTLALPWLRSALGQATAGGLRLS